MRDSNTPRADGSLDHAADGSVGMPVSGERPSLHPIIEPGPGPESRPRRTLSTRLAMRLPGARPRAEATAASASAEPVPAVLAEPVGAAAIRQPVPKEPPPDEMAGGPAIRRSAVIVLIVALVAAGAFVFIRGGLTYPLQPPKGASPTSQGALRPTSSPSLAAVVPSLVASTWPSASPSPTESVATSPTARPTPKETPRPTPTPRPTSDRFAVLDKCPSTPDCWIYTVRSGDNLYSIANWFGVSLERVEAMNPWVRTSGLRAGQDLRIPTPTR